MSEKTDKIKKVLETYRAQLCKYKKAFMEDGTIDKGEQEQLDKLEGLISQCEKKLGVVQPKKEKPIISDIMKKSPVPITMPSLLNPLGLDPKFLPQMEMWPMDVNDYLEKNRGMVSLNLVKNTIKTMRAKVKGIEDVSDKNLDIYIREWAKVNYVLLQFDKNPKLGSVDAAMDDFFGELKKLGKFDWKFGGGYLNMNLQGQTAVLGFKGEKDEASLTANTDGVEVKAKGKVADVEGSVEGKIDYKGEKGEAKASVKKGNVELKGNIKVDASDKDSKDPVVTGGGELSVKKDNTKVTIGAEVDKDGMVTASASLKIDDIINFNGSSGGVTIFLKGNEKSWSFGLELSTSGGKEAHLSQFAAEELKKTIYTASDSLKEIYTILGEEELTLKNAKAIKERIKPHFDNVEKAIKQLSKNVKKPVPKSELFFSFGVSGSEETGVVATAGLTFTF